MTKARIIAEGPLRELMSAMSGSQEEQPKDHPIHPLAQAMELRDRFRRAHVKAALEPGMLCREKPGMAALKTSRLIIFWRWLKPEDTQDALIIEDAVANKAVNCTDCMVGFLDHEGDLIVVCFESWRLEPCAEFDAEVPA